MNISQLQYICILTYEHVNMYINTYHTHTHTHTHTHLPGGLARFVVIIGVASAGILVKKNAHTHTRTHTYVYIHRNNT